MGYALHVRFKSNERPFSTFYEPLPAHQPKTDADAIVWASRMQEGLGGDYTCVLVGRDGDVLLYDEAATGER